METRKGKKKRLMESRIQHIPEEIIVQILSGLPMKSLVRFKCVCKTWQSWTSNMTGQERSFFYLKPSYYSKGNIRFYTVDKELVVEELPSPILGLTEENFKFLGSCNGLLLFSVSTCFYIWNPTTRSCKEVLQLNLLAEKPAIEASGLCFDDSTNDYMVMIGLEDQTQVTKFVLVGSLKSKEWLEVDLPYAVARSGCYVNGRLHWIVEENIIFGPNLIVYFDAKTLKFNKLPMPNNVNSIGRLGVVDGCLSMGYRTLWISEILIMREYGVKESWTTIWKGRNKPRRKRNGYSYRLPGIDRQVSSINEDYLVAKFCYLWDIRVWQLNLNLKENSVDLRMNNYRDYWTWDTYIESLAPVDGVTPDINRHSKTFEDKIRWLPISEEQH